MKKWEEEVRVDKIKNFGVIKKSQSISVGNITYNVSSKKSRNTQIYF